MCLALPGCIISLAGNEPFMRTGRVDFGGVVKKVSLALVPEVGVGEFVMVHAGVAIGVVDTVAARNTIEWIGQLSEAGNPEDTAP